jgi:hypothetical protein
MSKRKSGAEHWNEVRETLSAKLESFYAQLDVAYANAHQTFADRLAKSSGRTMKAKLTASQNAIETNYALAKAHRTFCEDLISRSDAVFQETAEQIRNRPVPRDLSGIAVNGEIALAAQTVAGTSKIVVDALSLCGFLGGLLGHKEAKAFEKGAIKELQGAIFDPGAGVVTLLKRLYAVASRTLRTDQDADELLESLDTFVDLMTQWRAAVVLMSKGQTFVQAIPAAFAKLAAKP